MPGNTRPSIRLDKLEIINFKGIDRLTVDFPLPLMQEDPDVFALGSENGLGKTSILECVTLLYLASCITDGEKSPILPSMERESLFNPLDILIRSGESSSIIEGLFSFGPSKFGVSLTIDRHSGLAVTGDTKKMRNSLKLSKPFRTDYAESALDLILSASGFDSEPLILGPFIYFHSYRKVVESNPEFGMMVESDRLRRQLRMVRRGAITQVSTFKVEILRSLMGRGELFENVDSEESKSSLDTLNDLALQFAGGEIAKLRPGANNTLEFRIQPKDGSPSFSFDGLSSGQKEIISTLFLVWKHTSVMPGIVLIDEPEMHLNAQWHKILVNKLVEMQPRNQYIIATHSEDVFASVEPSHRMLLRGSVMR